MKILILMVVIFAEKNLQAQVNSRAAILDQYAFNQPIFDSSRKTIIPGLLSDPTKNYRSSSPMMISSSSYDWRMQNNFFWVGNVTTMSYNKGKFGTYFYWDVQGNLRGTRGFIDISGKNKRGLKLTFLWKSIIKNKF